MDALFPPGQPIGRDQILVIITQTSEQVRGLTSAVSDLKSAVEEMVHRFEADYDEVRSTLGGLAALRNGHGDLGRRIQEVENKASNLFQRTTELETWRTTEKAWIAAGSLFAGLIGWLASHFLH